MGCVNGCNWGDDLDPLIPLGNGAYECELCGRTVQCDGWPLPSEYYRRARLSSFAKETKTAEGIVVGFDPARVNEHYTGLYYLLDPSEGLPLSLDDVMWIQQHTTPREMFGDTMTSESHLDRADQWCEYRKVFTDLPSDPNCEEALVHQERCYDEFDRVNAFPLRPNSILSVYSENGEGRYPVKVKRCRDDLSRRDVLAIDIARDEADLYEEKDDEGYVTHFGIVSTFNLRKCTCAPLPESTASIGESVTCDAIYASSMFNGDATRLISEEKTSIRIKLPCGTVASHRRVKPSSKAYRDHMGSIAGDHAMTVVKNLKRLSARLLTNEGQRRLIIVDNVYETAVAPDDIKEIEKRRDETVRLFAQRRDLSYIPEHYAVMDPDGDDVPVGRWALVSYSKIAECHYDIVTTAYTTKILYSDSDYKPKASGLL